MLKYVLLRWPFRRSKNLGMHGDAWRISDAAHGQIARRESSGPWLWIGHSGNPGNAARGDCAFSRLCMLTVDFVSLSHPFTPYLRPITFQNESVLQHITIPNVITNAADTTTVKEKCCFFSGDWANYVAKTSDQEMFDVILTSETIYNTRNYGKIIRVLREKLKSDGICYLAAKQHYFGVGGSIGQFKSAVSKSGGFQVETVYTCTENVAREILQITANAADSLNSS